MVINKKRRADVDCFEQEYLLYLSSLSVISNYDRANSAMV